MFERLTPAATLENSDGVPFIAFDVLKKYPWLIHGFSTRLGGISTGYYASMNLGLGNGDDEETVLKNYELLCSEMGIDHHDLVFTDQVHKTVIREAAYEDKGKGIYRERTYSEIDGTVTNLPGLPLLVFGADCVPVFFVDPVHRAIGVAHSGWKGTAEKISACAIRKLSELYGSKPEDIVCVTGPSICQDCYEVSSDVFEAFSKNFTSAETESFFIAKPNGKYQLSLWEAIKTTLINAGVREENITISGVCTMCRKDLLFSHRRDGSRRGSMAGFMMLREDIK